MTPEKEDNCRDDERTSSNIEKYGLSIIMIEATDYLPSFAYSIGLWKTYNHPEIICFGLRIETLHALFNDVADIIKNGQKIEVGKNYDQIFESGLAEFISVDKRNLSDYFGGAIDYHKTKDFPAMQLVWTDRNNKFPWESDYEEEFVYKQPLLDRNAEFKFREEKNLGIFTTRQWLDLKKPILRVIHDEDGDWQFLTGDQLPEDIRLVCLEEIVQRDKTLNEIFDLDYGESAEREFIGNKWTRTKVTIEDE